MFFLIRCAFWLGLVFMALPWDGEDLRSELAKEAESATRAVAGHAQSLCLKDPMACTDHAATIAKSFGGTQSQNTLQPGDLAPAWRGPAPPALRRSPG